MKHDVSGQICPLIKERHRSLTVRPNIPLFVVSLVPLFHFHSPEVRRCLGLGFGPAENRLCSPASEDFFLLSPIPLSPI